MTLGCHMILKPRDESLLLRQPGDARRVARIVLEIGRAFDLRAFSVADNHLHLDNAGGRSSTTEFGRRLKLSLGTHLEIAAGFGSSFIEPYANARHQRNAFAYVLRQREHHGLLLDPLREASNLLDLLGLRPLGAYTAAHVRRSFPRLRREQLLTHLGTSALSPCDGTPEETVAAGLAAACLPRLEQRCSERAPLIATLASLLTRRFPATEVARVLGITPRSVRRARQRRAPRALLEAIGLQIDLARQKAPEGLTLSQPFTPTVGETP